MFSSPPSIACIFCNCYGNLLLTFIWDRVSRWQPLEVLLSNIVKSFYKTIIKFKRPTKRNPSPFIPYHPWYPRLFNFGYIESPGKHLPPEGTTNSLVLVRAFPVTHRREQEVSVNADKRHIWLIDKIWHCRYIDCCPVFIGCLQFVLDFDIRGKWGTSGKFHKRMRVFYLPDWLHGP